MADISKGQALKIAREAGAYAHKHHKHHGGLIQAEMYYFATNIFKLGRNAGLDEAKLACGEVEKHPSLGARHCIEAIESLKDNTP